MLLQWSHCNTLEICMTETCKSRLYNLQGMDLHSIKALNNEDSLSSIQ